MKKIKIRQSRMAELSLSARRTPPLELPKLAAFDHHVSASENASKTLAQAYVMP